MRWRTILGVTKLNHNGCPNADGETCGSFDAVTEVLPRKHGVDSTQLQVRSASNPVLLVGLRRTARTLERNTITLASQARANRRTQARTSTDATWAHLGRNLRP